MISAILGRRKRNTIIQTSTVIIPLLFEFCFLLKLLQNIIIFLRLLPVELLLNIRPYFIDLNTKIETPHITVPIARCHMISSMVAYHNFNTIEINQYQIPKIIMRSLLNIFSFYIFSMSGLVKLQYERSSHSRSFSPSRIYVTTYVDISFATRLSLRNLVQFLQMAKKPSLVMPVDPINSS